jgi:hypothetical protein
VIAWRFLFCSVPQDGTLVHFVAFCDRGEKTPPDRDVGSLPLRAACRHSGILWLRRKDLR